MKAMVIAMAMLICTLANRGPLPSMNPLGVRSYDQHAHARTHRETALTISLACHFSLPFPPSPHSLSQTSSMVSIGCASSSSCHAHTYHVAACSAQSSQTSMPNCAKAGYLCARVCVRARVPVYLSACHIDTHTPRKMRRRQSRHHKRSIC